MTFGNDTSLDIKLSDHVDISSFSASLDSIGLKGGEARVDNALRQAHKELFTIENGGRDKIRNVVVLITDSPQGLGKIYLIGEK